MSDALCELGIAAAARLIAARELSSVELTSAFLSRIEALNPRLNAFLTVTAEQAMNEARAADARMARSGPRGPMQGVPYALKDIYDTAGVRTTGNSALLAQRVPEHDCACAQRLRAAGAVLLGKLTTHELATGGPAYDLPWPPASNPWRLGRFPGGSSSGAGAAVAAGLAPVALGSDTGGSIRLPAAFCGVAGIKPSYGRVSKRGVLPLSWTLDNCGPLAWTVEDCAIALGVIAGHDPLDPASSPRPVPDYRQGLERGVAGVRIGVVRHFYERDERASDETVAAMDASLQVLRELGAQLREVQLPPLADYQACYRGIVLSEAFAIHGADLRARPQSFAAITRYRILPGALLSAADYANALRFQRYLVARTAAVLQEVEALVCATTYGPAPLQARMRPAEGFARAPLTNPFNVAQLPAVSVCNGFSREGLPLAMQVAGRAFDEPMVLRVARAYESATPWRETRPRLLEDAGESTDGEPDAPAPPPPAADLQRYRQRADAAGLVLSEEMLAELCEAMPGVEALLERIPAGRDYDSTPSTVFRHE